MTLQRDFNLIEVNIKDVAFIDILFLIILVLNLFWKSKSGGHWP